jgi:hypothetical protein
MRLSSTAALAAALMMMTPCGAQGQFSQYTQPGTVGRGREAAVEREQMAAAVEEARWRLGPLRLEPWVGLRDLSWNDNPGGSAEGEETEGDLSVSAGAGLRGYLPTGPDVVLAAHALPEYLWYADDEARRRLNGRYGAGAFGFFNRLTVQATGQRTEQLAILSAEEPEQANTRQDSLELAGLVELGFSTSVFLEAGVGEVRNLLNEEERETGPQFQLLDRDETRLRTGLRFQPRERWSFAVGVEWTETRVLSDERDLSTTGSAPVAAVAYRGPKLVASAEVESHRLEPAGDSIFPATDATTAALQVGVVGNRLSPTLYARRSLALAVTEGYSHFATEVVGLAAVLDLGYRSDLRAFAETGRSEFTAISEAVPAREDDLSAFGGEIGFRLGRVRFHVGGYRAEFDSSVPGEDRSVSILGTGASVGLGGEQGAGWP